jgi:hypothetical protein
MLSNGGGVIELMCLSLCMKFHEKVPFDGKANEFYEVEYFISQMWKNNIVNGIWLKKGMLIETL